MSVYQRVQAIIFAVVVAVSHLLVVDFARVVVVVHLVQVDVQILRFAVVALVELLFSVLPVFLVVVVLAVWMDV